MKRRLVVIGAFVLLVGAGLGAAGVVFASSHATLTTDPSALARVSLPLGGGRIERISAVSGPHASPVPVTLRGHQIWPARMVPANRQMSIEVIIRRPSWVSWLAGKTERLRLTLTTPAAHLLDHFLTVAPGAPLRLAFGQPIAAIAYGPAGRLARHTLTPATSVVTLDRVAAAGSMWIAAAPRSWEQPTPSLITWFPTGSAASAIANPAPGSRIGPATPITLTFSKTVQQALGHHRPPVLPITPGTWHQINPHTIVFRPEGAGYGLAAKVSIGLPNGVRLIGGQSHPGGDPGNWVVPPGSTLRLQQVLATLGYLPLHFNPAGSGVPLTAQAQENAAVNPPSGSLSWAYPNVPGALRTFWAPGASGVMTRGAVMAFENDHGLSPDGVPGPEVWRTLISAVLTGRSSRSGYTFVSVDEATQRLTLWHDGQSVVTTPVNTGIASAPTNPGTYAVYEHIPSGTMSGTNPDGSHYHDPGIPWISYFNGGDALHGFYRAQYGFPQSLGCVEMPVTAAGKVYPFTPIGTLVHIA
ncbi:MAG: L,D-transpeptidase family protein [Actinomycetota bacterium]|nr:L,D-transpeptidase family protein [Actinomycetota bacterium]